MEVDVWLVVNQFSSQSLYADYIGKTVKAARGVGTEAQYLKWGHCQRCFLLQWQYPQVNVRSASDPR
jgi:hypothetical protein